MRARDRRSRPYVPLFVGLALLVHVHVVLVAVAILSLNPEGCSPAPLPMKPIEVAVVPVDPDPIKPKDLAKEEKKEEKKDREVKGQVVELPKPLDERRPDKSRFLSEYDSKVAKETKAERPNRPGKLRAQRAPTPRRRATAAQRRQVMRKIMKLAMRQPKPKAQPEIPKSQIPQAKTGQKATVKQPEKPKKPKVKVKVVGVKPTPQKGASKKQITMKDLRLSDAELAKAIGAGVQDHLKDVKKGKQTLLNSKRWRFASFFNRVKRQVAQNWHPNRVYRRRDPRGRVYGFKDRLTVLRVKLTPQGKLKGVHLEKASGVGFLDDEAVRAFRLAQPFPNPPQGLVDAKTGLISFRFGFLFEISRSPSFKIFRYR